MEYHINYSTVTINVTWEPPSDNYSRVDLYCYQIITEGNASGLVFNTTENVSILSELPRDVEILFVISAYNCRGASAQVTLIIDIGKQFNMPHGIT